MSLDAWLTLALLGATLVLLVGTSLPPAAGCTGMVGATITPAAYQTNLMVYEDGGYTTLDFVKLGVPLTARPKG